jgi:putative hemolysin
MRHSEKLGLAMSGFVSAIARIFKPVVWFLTKSTNFLLRLLGIDPEAEDDTVTEEEIRMLVDAGSEKGAIDIEEKEMIQNIFEFDDTAVSEIMTHRTEVSVLWLDETDKQWAETIEGSHYSIYPICAETADDIVGVLYTKDYFRLKDKSRENVMKDAVRPAYLVPETVKINVLFKNMKQHRNHFAVVLDEYGGMSGIVTINDLLEELVGDMEDHYDKPNDVPLIERIDSNTWKIQGIMTLDELSKELGIIFPEEEYDTFGGFVFDLLGTIPEDGSTPEVEGLGLVIKVTEIKDHRMESAIVYKSRDAETIDAIDINDKDY